MENAEGHILVFEKLKGGWELCDVMWLLKWICGLH